MSGYGVDDRQALLGSWALLTVLLSLPWMKLTVAGLRGRWNFSDRNPMEARNTWVRRRRESKVDGEIPGIET